jgi:hypothetical protein
MNCSCIIALSYCAEQQQHVAAQSAVFSRISVFHFVTPLMGIGCHAEGCDVWLYTANLSSGKQLQRAHMAVPGPLELFSASLRLRSYVHLSLAEGFLYCCSSVHGL